MPWGPAGCRRSRSRSRSHAFQNPSKIACPKDGDQTTPQQVAAGLRPMPAPTRQMRRKGTELHQLQQSTRTVPLCQAQCLFSELAKVSRDPSCRLSHATCTSGRRRCQSRGHEPERAAVDASLVPVYISRVLARGHRRFQEPRNSGGIPVPVPHGIHICHLRTTHCRGGSRSGRRRNVAHAYCRSAALSEQVPCGLARCPSELDTNQLLCRLVQYHGNDDLRRGVSARSSRSE